MQKLNFKKKDLILMLDGFEKLNGKQTSKIYRILLNLKKINLLKNLVIQSIILKI